MVSQIRTEKTEQMKMILSQKRLTRKKRESWKKRNWLHSKLPR